MNPEELVNFDPRIPKHKPVLTRIIIVLICIMFIAEIYFKGLYSDKALIILGAKWNEGITNGEYWRFFSCTLLHGGLLHLFLNLAALHIFGSEVESTFGSFRFLLIYLISSWGAGLASYAFSSHLAIGASGALFGIIGSLVMFFFRQRERVSGATMRFKSMYTLIIINLMLGLLIPRIDNSAHIGGVITGLITGWFISPEYNIEKDEMIGKLHVVKKRDLTRVIAGLFLVLTILYWLTKLAISIQLTKAV